MAAFWLRGDYRQENVPVVVLVSFMIGGFIGAFAGGLGGLIRVRALGGFIGAAVGGCLAFGVTFLTCLPLLLTVGHGSRGGDAGAENPDLYFTVMTITGVIAGGLGGLAGGLLRGKKVDAVMGAADREKQERTT
jgi:hypothetical protein